MKKIAIIGPESTGKSTLAQQLSDELSFPLVPEFAREYLKNLNREYKYSDLSEIAKGQIASEDKLADTDPPLLICDTELTVIKIWSLHRFKQVEGWIEREIRTRTYDHYFLMYIDSPWVDDPLREHPELRNYFFNIYLDECKKRRLPYTIIKGKENERLESALKVIGNLH